MLLKCFLKLFWSEETLIFKCVFTTEMEWDEHPTVFCHSLHVFPGTGWSFFHPQYKLKSARLHWLFICLICPHDYLKITSSLDSQCPSFVYKIPKLPCWYFFQAWIENNQRSTRFMTCPFKNTGQRSPLTLTDVHLTDDLLISDGVHSRLQGPKKCVAEHLSVFSQRSTQPPWLGTLVESVCPLQAVRWSVASWTG